MTHNDQKLIEEALPQLQEYLLGDELYGSLGGNLPRLTPGNLLLALKRLEAVDPPSAQTLRGKLEAIQTQWRSAWEKKIARETASRLRLWSQFLSEQTQDEGPHDAHYAASVRERVILQLLQCSAPQLAELDSLLRARFKPGRFAWEAVYQDVFPEGEFWFLYGGMNSAIPKEIL